jgi:cytochrome c oxidase cbb3-type subunit I/II
VQWWYGHNAVGFFLTTPILGIMYYFIPKAAGRPVYSYRLSIVHFWALVFVYIWAGPHHLLYTALPDWSQTLGMVFSIMLWAPSWGGMLNGLLTLRGAWDRVRTDPVLKFFAMGVTFYGMSTFEGPLLSIKSVSALAHYTDWIVGHVHGGALGWNGFMAAGMFYWLVPRLWNTKLRSVALADAHFWMGTFGILLYITSMWISGVNQGLYWRALDGDGFLKYPDFVEGLRASRVLYMMRLAGGVAYLAGFLLMTGNLLATIRQGRAVNGEAQVVVPATSSSISLWRLMGGAPVVISALAIAVSVLLGIASPLLTPLLLTVSVVIVVAAIVCNGIYVRENRGWHRLLEGRPLAMTVLALFAILVGGVVELVPVIVLRREVPVIPEAVAADAREDIVAVDAKRVQKPCSPLELAGRDIYVREGCYNCHSQMIRPLRHETLRYGEFSRAEEYVYDHPFQWGSKRTGPDLHRVGGKYPNLWHYEHMKDPRSTSPDSNMPSYSWLHEQSADLEGLPTKLEALRKVGVPYTDEEIHRAPQLSREQARIIIADLQEHGISAREDAEIIALIAYLQRLGRGPQFTPAGTVMQGGR